MSKATEVMTKSFIEQLVSNGGPDVADDSRIEVWLTQVASEIGSGELSSQAWQTIGAAFGEALSPKTMQGFALTKPHGYAGDFEMLEKIYTRHVTDEASLKKWDEYFHRQKAPIAVRNRKTYFINLLRELDATAVNGREQIEVLNVASGPARDVFEYFSQCHNGSRLFCDCLDHDPKAIAYATDLCREHLANIAFHRTNAFRFVPRKKYQLVWSAGLFDYLDDNSFKALLRRLYDCVGEGGELVIGNFSDNNPTRNYMELLGEWFLHHRSRERLLQLAQECDIPDAALSVGQEEESVNLFLHVKRCAR